MVAKITDPQMQNRRTSALKSIKNVEKMKPIRPKLFQKRFGFAILLYGILTITSCIKQDIFPASGTPNQFISILDIRKLHKGADVVLTKENMDGADKITGVIVSDASAGNIPAGVFAMQQTSRTLTRGIEIVVGNQPVSFNVGDSVVVRVDGANLIRNNGTLQVKLSSLDQVSRIATNRAFEPMLVDLNTLNLKFADYEGTLVKIAHVNAEAGGTLAGDVVVSENNNNTGIIHTEASANFANKAVALNASYTAIARWNNNANGENKKQLWLVNSQSVEAESGRIYENFPEKFETGDASLFADGYSTKTGNLATGSYTLQNIYLGNTGNDLPISGSYALRLVGASATSSWCTMNYDLPNGATKITLWAGSYGASADLGSTWRVEYSQNQGVTWTQVGEDILTVSKVKKQFTFLMDIRGQVRFRIGKVGIGESTTNNQNGRFSMDDFAVYKNPEDGGPITNPIPEYENIVAWQFGTPAAAGNEVSKIATSSNSGISGAILTRGIGLNASTLSRAFASNAAGAQVTATKALAVNQDVYYQARFVVEPGHTLSLTAINTRLRRSGAGAKNHKWYYSLDGINFKETIGTGDMNYEGTDGEGVEMPTYYLYQTSELQNIPAGATVTLRMYCWGFTNIGSGSFSIGRTAASTTNEVLTIGGKLTQ